MILHGDLFDVLPTLAADSFDSCVTDPPYGLEFMGRDWDSFHGDTVDPAFCHWFAGFTDGEGCFSVHKKNVNGYETYDCQFSISLRADNRPILERIHRTLAIGTMSSREAGHSGDGHPKARYAVSAKAELVALRDLFRAFPLRAKKARDFEIWSEALDAWLKHEPGEWSEMAEARARLMSGRAFDPQGVHIDQFQMWCHRWAREVFRVLKPGAYLVAFGGTRTHHRLMCALEDAGFELRDTLMWLFGSGFPKSLDVSKAIDEAAGVERPIVGYDASRARPNRLYETSAIGHIGATGEGPICDRTDNGATRTGPASEASRQWQGWGTALKPAYEPIVLARKPLAGTVATNVLKHGTGALNIDATRVGVESRTYSGSGPHRTKLDNHGPGDTGLGLMDGRGKDLEFTATGRWPANVVLSHHPDCVQTGTREVPRELRGQHGPRPIENASSYDMGSGHALGTAEETIGTFACVPDCPVALLDAQSGEAGNGWTRNYGTEDYRGRQYDGGVFGGGGYSGTNTYADAGGASRFFYTAKASRSERDLGTEHLDPQPQDPSRKDGNPGGDNPRNRGLSLRGNHHPTVKPVDLMRWLVTLVTPPKGRVLDCFFGSGSTGVACERTGHPYLGVERDPAYVAIATRRCEAITPLFAGLDDPDPASPEEAE